MQIKQKTTSTEVVFDGGERGIRTLGACYRTPAFQASTFDHSDISPCSTALSLYNVETKMSIPILNFFKFFCNKKSVLFFVRIFIFYFTQLPQFRQKTSSAPSSEPQFSQNFITSGFIGSPDGCASFLNSSSCASICAIF